MRKALSSALGMFISMALVLTAIPVSTYADTGGTETETDTEGGGIFVSGFG